MSALAKLKQSLQRPEFILGVAVPLVPAFGLNALLICAVIYLICTKNKNESSQGIKAAAPFLIIIALWIIIDCVAGFNLGWWYYNLSSTENIKALILYLFRGTSSYQIAITGLVRFAVLFLLYDRFVDCKEKQEQLQKGLFWGIAVAALLLLLQINGLLDGVFPHQTRYWTGQGRFTGSFSDPNALGLFVFLSLPLFFSDRRLQSTAQKVGLLLSITLWIWIGCFSGSRTLLLGLGILGCLYLFKRVKNRLHIIKLLTLIFVLISLVYSYLPKSFLPVAVLRAVETVTPGNISTALFSRAIFFKTTLSLWQENPLVGIGFEHFRYFFPSLSFAQGVDLNLWTDNPNNFYLGILVELGIIGFVAFLLTVFSFKPKAEPGLSQELSGITVFVFLILLVLGPHLVFDEIMLLFAFLLSRSFKVKRVMPHAFFLAALIPCTALMTAKALVRERGFYAWQKDTQGFYRWTSNQAKSFYQCQNNLPKALLIKSEYPTTVIINSSESLILGEKEARTILLPCSEGSKIPYTLKVEGPWVPLFKSSRKDGRLLGVKVYSPDGVTTPF